MTQEKFKEWKESGNFTLALERIHEVSSHIAKGLHDSYTKQEAAEVAMYHNWEASQYWGELQGLKGTILLAEAKQL